MHKRFRNAVLSVSVAAFVVMGFGVCSVHEANAHVHSDSHDALVWMMDSDLEDAHCQDDTAADDVVMTSGSLRDTVAQLVTLVAPSTAPMTDISNPIAGSPPLEITRSFTDGKTALPLRC